MAGLLDLFSGRSSDIYGNGLLTPEQRGGLGNIGLLALAGKLGQLAGPSFSPVPDFGAALGQAAGAYGASQEGAGTAALNAILTGQKGQKLQQELDYYKQLGPILGKLAGQWPGADGGTAATPETGSTGGGAAASLGAGGGGPGRMSYDQVLQLVLAKGFPADKAPIMAATIMAESGGNPSAANLNPSDPGGSYGLTQINAGAHGPKAKEALGNPDRAVELAYDISKGGTDFTPWSAYKSGAYRRFLPQGGAAPTAAAPAPAGGGGLLAPTAPNPLSDAEPMVPIVRPAVAPQAAVGPPRSAGNITPAERVAWIQSRVAGGQDTIEEWVAKQRGGSGGGGLLAAPPAAGTDSYVTPQGPAGDPGPAGPAGPATPRAPLPTMGPAGIELPPMQGPLAAPAPAAAAPAAPGPGLLSPGMPAAPALPRVNPAYDALLRNLGLAGALAEGAGLKNVLGPIQQALEASPAYKGQVKTAEEAASDPFIRGRAEQKAQLDRVNDLAKSGGIIGPNGEVVPWQGFQELLKANEAAKAEGTEDSTRRQKILEFHLDNLKNGKVVDPRTGETLPARGAIELEQEKAAAIPTPEAKNYNDYVKDAQMRNQPVLSRFDWERTKGSPDPDKAARIALDLKVAEPLAAQAAAGVQAKPLLDEVVRLAYQTPEGMAGEGSAAAGKLMAAFGFAPTDRMSNAELLTGLQQRLIGPIREPGTSSDRDVSRYLLATPGLMSTGDGRVKMAEMTKALIDRNNELAQVYRNNLGSPDLQSKLAIVHNKPLFSDEQRAAIDETIRTRGGTVPGGVTPGERVPAATAPPASTAPAGGKQIGTYQGKPVYLMPDGSRKWDQ